MVKFFIQTQNIGEVTIKSGKNTFRLTSNQINLFQDYAEFINQIKSRVKSHNYRIKKECVKKDVCQNKRVFFLDRILGNEFNDGLIISNPILTYMEITQEIKIISQIKSKKHECYECFEDYLKFLVNIQELLSKTKFLTKFFSLSYKKGDLSEIYSIILEDHNLLTDYSITTSMYDEINENICTSYKKGPYIIKIIQNLQSNEIFYEVSSIIQDPVLKDVYSDILQKLKINSIDYFDFNTPCKLDNLLKHGKHSIMFLIKQKYGSLSNEVISDLAELMLFELTNLNHLMAFLIDDEIEEIFLDSPKSYIYIDHRQFGRCQTNISLTSTEIESLKTRLRIEAEQRLDEIEPFLKTEILSSYFHVRVTIQIFPLSFDGFSMSIRKLHKKTLTIIDLIENNTLSLDAAAYLIFNFLHGRCILVIGPPYSGKTTLINSLDMLGKKDWRKIYIEDVIESIDQSSFGVHQVRFQVDPIPKSSKYYSQKSFQVKECLHRTPDSIFIGELIHSKSVEAFFFLLKVGLRRCLATSHGESPELIVERFTYDDNIPPSLIGNLDVIVQMKRLSNGNKIIRRVTRITEVKKTINGLNENLSNQRFPYNLELKDIFFRNPTIDQLESVYKSLNELYTKSEIIRKINSLRGEFICENDFQLEIEAIKQFLKELLKENKWTLSEIIKKFHEFWSDFPHNLKSKVLPNFSSQKRADIIGRYTK
ncbi:MAG: ATPase, T2SS/T4P/T4SS family [Candidatus Helarchaeota archaeon]